MTGFPPVTEGNVGGVTWRSAILALCEWAAVVTWCAPVLKWSPVVTREWALVT